MYSPKHSRQGKSRKEQNCGQHCIAMICNLPVGVVNAQIGHTRGTTARSVEDLLRWFGMEYSCYEKPVVGGLPELCIAHVVHHWIVIFRQSQGFVGSQGFVVYDSCLDEPVPLGKYRHRIKGIIRVHVPNFSQPSSEKITELCEG